MAISANIYKLQTYMRFKGGIPATPYDMPIAASQTIKKGDFLVKTGGKVTKAIAPSGSINTTVGIGVSTLMIGVAAQGIVVDASGVSTDGRAVTTVPVIPIGLTEHMLCGTGAIGATTSTTWATNWAALVGQTNVALVIGTSAAITTWSFALTTAVTNANMTVIALSEESSTTETYPYIWCEVLRAAQIGA